MEPRKLMEEEEEKKIKKCTLFECQCIQHESANWGHYFYAS